LSDNGIKQTIIKSWSDNRQAWISTVLLFIVLEIAVLSLELARWITPQPALTLILVLSMLAAGLLIKSRLPAIVAHIAALGIGGGITAWQTHRLAATETIAFAVFLSILVWITGYFSTWFTIRRKNAWVAVCLGTLVILANLSNLPDNYYYFFGLYFVTAVLLITWTRMVKRNYVFKNSRNSPARGFFYTITILLCIIIVAVSVARVIPGARFPQMQDFIATRMLQGIDLEDSFFNLFAKVPAKQPLNTSMIRQDLKFGKTWKQREQIEFLVRSPQPSYWRVKIYDTYTSQGWKNAPINGYLLEKGTPWGDLEDSNSRETITYTVTANMKTDALLTAGDYVSSDTTAMVGISSGDVMSVTTPRILGPGERYTVTSSIPSPSREALATVGEGYPASLSYRYLRLPADFSDEIRLLSANLTSHAETPYQKVMAIDEYLSSFPYEEEIEAPPAGVDGVEHFLFNQKSGFCLYFASAMTVMLRSVDVPARLAVGYTPGEPGEREGEYILRNKHYHAWPQAYFAGYGWVDLEATPGGAGSQVAIETPWITAAPSSEQPLSGMLQPWYASPYWYQTYGINQGIPEPKPKFYSPRLPFADELRHAVFILLLATAASLFVITIILILRSVSNRRLWRVDREHLASSIYAKTCQLAAMAGLGPRPQQTPQEFVAGLAAEFPNQAGVLEQIVQAYSENRFGRKRGKPGLFEEAIMLKARRNAYEGLIKRLGPVRRLFTR
jgi:transglutaminase-like putative cysteine protease